MKRIFFAAILLITAVAYSGAAPSPLDDSVAVADSPSGAFINPAVLSFGNGTGMGYAQNFGADGLTDDFTFFINSSYFGYAYDQQDSTASHTFNLSLSPYDNLYLGSALITESFTPDKTSWKLGALVRPTDHISIGTTVSIPPSGDTECVSGIALRPPFLPADHLHRLTLFSDLPWNADGVSAPAVGIRLEPVDGFRTGFAYDIENKAFGFSLSLAIAGLRGGSYVRTDTSADLDSGALFVQLSPRPFTYPYSVSADLYYDYDLGDQIVELGQGFRSGGFYFLLDQKTVLSTLDELKRIEDAPYIDGIVLINQHPAMSFSTMLEIRDALQRIRDKGKKIVFYSEYMNSLEYILAASVGDAVYLYPQGLIDLKGLSVSSPYLNTFLNNYGIDVANFHTGEYKTAYNYLSESGMPESEREALDYMLEGLHGDMVRMIAEVRGDLLQKEVQLIISDGPYLVAEKALAAGMIDALIPPDKLEETVPFFESDTLVRKNIPLDLVRTDWSDPYASKVALIRAVGPIVTGEGVPGNNIGAETLAASIRAARKDNQIKAILLRINSGGGSALASDLIAREVELCRTGKNAKPVIVSMSGSAASGGYYIAAFAEKIVASPVALTGSIGVIAVFPNFAGLLEQQEIGWDTVKKGEHADFGVMYRELTEDEELIVREFIDSSYDRFLTVVSEGRGLPKDQVREIAGGRVWTGRQAMERGLVDEIGGYKKAFEAVAEAADIRGEIELIDYTYSGSRGVVSLGRLPEMGAHLFGPHREEMTSIAAELPPELKHLYRYYAAAGDGPESFNLMVMPYYIKDVTTE